MELSATTLGIASSEIFSTSFTCLLVPLIKVESLFRQGFFFNLIVCAMQIMIEREQENKSHDHSRTFKETGKDWFN